MTHTQLWTLDLQAIDTPPEPWLALLDDQETAQGNRFVRGADRLAYIAAHALLRRVLCQALGPGFTPRTLPLVRDLWGKPRLGDGASNGPHFNLSHTNGMVAVTVCPQGPVGVDVEALDRNTAGFSDIAASVLLPAEVHSLMGLPHALRPHAFLALWTAREAVAKADGRGLSLPFTLIHLDTDGCGATVMAPPRLDDGATAPFQNWRLLRNQPSQRHLLALAWPRNAGDVIHTVNQGP